MLRHKVLSFAEAWVSPQDSSISFSSAITDCRHVVFGRPRFLFPGGVHLSATLGMLSWGNEYVLIMDVCARNVFSFTILAHCTDDCILVKLKC